MAKLPTAFMPLSLGLESDFPKPQIPTHPQMHEVTEKELLAFLKNPCDLIGKQFELRDRRTQDDLFYEVVKLGVSKGKSHCFGVQFADCGGVVEMESDEMKMLLQESYQVDNWITCNAELKNVRHVEIGVIEIIHVHRPASKLYMQTAVLLSLLAQLPPKDIC